LETVYDKTCTDHIGGNINFDKAKEECLKDVQCIGIDRQNVVRSRTCGNTIVKLCRKLALRGICDCSNPSCSPSDCNRFRADKVTCIHQKGEIVRLNKIIFFLKANLFKSRYSKRKSTMIFHFRFLHKLVGMQTKRP